MLSNIFDYCLNVLRNNEHLTGDKALRTLAHLLTLKLLEPKIDEMNLVNYDYDFSDYNEDIIKIQIKRLFKILKFSKLDTKKEQNLPEIMNLLWDKILSEHPITKNIFIKDKGFDIEHESTYKKIINKLQSINFNNVDNDILGEVYEEVIKNVMTGKVLGQYFTPPNIKKFMVELINPRVFKDGTIETIFDPAAGTGGFLITSLKYLIKKSRTDFKKPIKLDWNFIKTKGLGGREPEPDTYQLAMSNMLISSGHIFSLQRGDSIRSPINDKYDIVLANPPFGIDGLNYSEINIPDKEKYLPIKSNSAVPLFLQVIIYILKVGGRCAVILPNGKELQSKSQGLIDIREFLLKTCNLHEVIYLPPKTFTHTNIKTCILYFTKIALEPEDCKTNELKFYNLINGNKVLLITVSKQQLIDNNYSLNHVDYTITQGIECSYKNAKTLAEVCEFKAGKQLSKSKFISGTYPVIGGGKEPVGLHNTSNRDENTILCSSSGQAGYISKYSEKVWASDCFSIHSKTKDLNEKYLYYYLKGIQDKIYDLRTGVAQPHIYPKSIENIKIPIPSIKVQLKIIKDNEYLENKIKENIEENIQLKNIIKNKIFTELNI